MKIRRILIILLVAVAASATAQSREDVRIYIPLVVAVEPMQADFFQRNFAMEIAAAGYTVTENVSEADYSMRLRVISNTTFNTDGTSSPASSDKHEYTLQIVLLRNSDNSQVVSLSFGFTELEEMYNHNLSLIYQTLANVPLSRSDSDKTLVKFMVGQDVDRDDWWRNKWLYLRVSLDYPISYYQIKPDGLYDGEFIFEGDDRENPDRYSRINRQIIAMPGATVGLELQFLSWMCLEADFEIRLWDTAGFAFIPGMGAQLKFPFKPAAYFMLEPYAAFAATDMFSRYAVGGGFQFGVKGGERGALFFDANYMYFLGEFTSRNADDRFTQPATLRWNRFVVGLSVGYKLGFRNRGEKREENSTWLFSNN